MLTAISRRIRERCSGGPLPLMGVAIVLSLAIYGISALVALAFYYKVLGGRP